MKRSQAFLLRFVVLLAMAGLLFWFGLPLFKGAQPQPKAALAQIEGKTGQDSPGGTGSSQGQRPVPVSVAQAVRRSVPVLLKAVGSVEASATVGIKSRIEGELVTVHFKEGQDVRQGERLFTIDSKPLEAALREAEAELERDRALLAKAEGDNRRYDELRKQHIISLDQYEQVSSNLAALRGTVGADEANVESARVQLGYTTIRAPLTGRTGRLLVDAGNMIKANADTPMLVIMQIEPVQVAFSVPEAYLAAIKSGLAAGGLTVEVSVPGMQDQVEKGRLSFVDNTVDSTTGTIALRASFANADEGLWPGQFVDVALHLSDIQGALVVPSRAVQEGQNGQYVFVVGKANTVELRSVKTGLSTEETTVVLSGIQEGERVVVDGQLRLKPGSSIEERDLPTQTARGEAS